MKKNRVYLPPLLTNVKSVRIFRFFGKIFVTVAMQVGNILFY